MAALDEAEEDPAATCDEWSIAFFPRLVLLRIADFLSPEDVIRLARSCRRLRDILPRFMVLYGKSFHINGPYRGHWAPELYFDGHILPAHVSKLTLSVKWADQGWGNSKGEIFVSLMRGDGPSEVVAEKRSPLGIAPHECETVTAELWDHAVVTLAQPGDFYRFMRNAGGGGGHTLTVDRFQATVKLKH